MCTFPRESTFKAGNDFFSYFSIQDAGEQEMAVHALDHTQSAVVLQLLLEVADSTKMRDG